MSPAPETTTESPMPQYHLIIDTLSPETVYVFLARPAGYSAPVRLTPLDPAYRVAFQAVRPAVARDPADPARFAEFRSREAAVMAGFVPVGAYRVCETWGEYTDPWPVGPAAAGTLESADTAAAADFPIFTPSLPAVHVDETSAVIVEPMDSVDRGQPDEAAGRTLAHARSIP
jgi:hypothetical protein